MVGFASSTTNMYITFVFVASIRRQLQTHRHPATLPQQLRLQQTERHRYQHQTEHQIHAAREQLDVRPVEQRLRRHQIAEANRRQRNEAEVRSVHQAPVLPQRKDRRANGNVANQYDQDDGDGHLRHGLPTVRPDAELIGSCRRCRCGRTRSGDSIIGVGNGILGRCVPLVFRPSPL